MKRWVGVGVVALLIVACATARRPDNAPPAHAPTDNAPTSPPGASNAAPAVALASRSVAELAAVVAVDAQRTDGATDAKIRESLATDAGRAADACLAQAPQAAACLYYHGVALGLEARAHPMHAAELLKTMLDALAGADAVDPDYDNAGPARVRALVLVRAPGWPVGPGDPDAGLLAARRAVRLRPLYPPNVLALGEALAKTGDAQGSRESYSRARALAQGLPESPDRGDWLREADKALQRN